MKDFLEDSIPKLFPSLFFCFVPSLNNGKKYNFHKKARQPTYEIQWQWKDMSPGNT